MKAIDVHGHFGTLDLGSGGLVAQLKSGDIEQVRRRAKAVGVCLTVVSPLRAFFPYGGDVLGGNEEACAAAENHADIRFWAVLDPRIRETFAQVESLLAHPRCRGIKIHPTCHNYPIREYGEAIFEFAGSHRTVIMTHTGDATCYPDAFIPLASRYPEVSLILAHMGYSNDGNISRQVYALKQAKAGNVYIDTSSSMSMLGRLVEWAVSQVGDGRLLFGSDTPLYSVASQKARIEYADFGEQTRQAILYDNAARLLGEEQMNCQEE